MSRSPRLAAGALSLLALAALPAGAAERLLVVRPVEGAPAVLADASGWLLEWNRRTRPLTLPEGAQVDAARALASGWLLAGTRPDARGTEVLLVADLGSGATELPPPGDRFARFRERPVPVVRDGALAGLVWLEGNFREEHAVRWAPWLGAGFGPAIEVAPTGPGSQLHLSAAPLADGRTLLVWAAFDGVDDEIRASILSADGWSRPFEIGRANDVPDITPSVRAAGGGALVAWSRFDGTEYRVALARFEGEAVRELPAVGPPGSLYPSLEAGEETPRLMWWDARTDRWILAELGEDGALHERAAAGGDADERPVVTVEGGRAVFRFGDRATTAPWR